MPRPTLQNQQNQINGLKTNMYLRSTRSQQYTVCYIHHHTPLINNGRWEASLLQYRIRVTIDWLKNMQIIDRLLSLALHVQTIMNLYSVKSCKSARGATFLEIRKQHALCPDFHMDNSNLWAFRWSAHNNTRGLMQIKGGQHFGSGAISVPLYGQDPWILFS